jgi:hypothetical protein
MQNKETQAKEFTIESWSQKYKSSINCSHPKGFSQKAHCAGKKKHNESVEMEMTCEDCGMCKTHGSLNEIKKGQKDSNGVTKCWPNKHAVGTKTGKNGGQVRNCVPNESVDEAANPAQQAAIAIAIKKKKGMSESYATEDEQLDGMSLGELKAIAQAAKKIYNSVKSGTPLEAWMYKMITNSNEGLTSVAQQIGNPEISEAEGERTMSRAAKGNEKYGKDGMKQLAKAGRDGASEKKLDSIRDKYDKYDDDNDENELEEGKTGPGLWANIHAKQNRIKHGSKEHMRKPGSKGAPTAASIKASQTNEDTDEDVTESNLYRILELSGLVNEEAELQFDKIEEWVESLAEAHGVDSEVIWEDFETVSDSELLSETAAWQKSAGKNKTGGLNQKGVNSYRREHPGSKLQTAVTTKPSKLKKGSKAAKRRKSFCARMSGMKGPMKKPNGKPTRKALSLRKWNC